MLNLPEPIVTFLCSTVVRDRFPAYLHMDKAGHLLAFGGACDRYGMHHLSLDQSVDEQIYFLAGLLPLQEAAMHIPFLQIEADIVAEVHLFTAQEEDWAIFFDATTENAKNVLIQQKVNDLSLLRRKQAQSLDHLIHPESVAESILDIQPAGEQKSLTILVIKCCNISGTHQTTANPLKALDAYLSTISPLILDEGGLIHQSIGNSIVAVFGALPSMRSAPEQAVAASSRILEICQGDHALKGTQAECALVITTGRATIGLLQVGFGKTLSVMGPPMEVAMHLNKNSEAGALIIDKPTFDGLDQRQRSFVPAAVTESSVMAGSPLYAYRQL
ncbi:hypothetical protein [Acaryochloris sp. IP29b_bin.137]|uniref:hypothetical protein n=1 Tax=Acaryochloris sp. IP29b_bin.137 TaxID=2969217 RepID=UPI0026159ED4|nr:hypothetical protein [Acaryochloris sp. IP29b_bin.137]